jgi:Flp pilus assembly protein TadG
VKRLLSFGVRLKRQVQGAVIVEFALLAPVLIAMMLGILQLGFAVQNYNAVRNVSADVARYALIQYTTGHPMTNDAITAQAKSIAVGAPYLLSPSEDRLHVDVATVATPQVTGTIEKTLTITYQIPTLVDFFGLHGPSISYSRSLIVPNS